MYPAKSLLLGVTLVFCVSACGDDKKAPTDVKKETTTYSATLHGRVFDAAAGATLSGAVVRVADLVSTTTDSEGKFTLLNVPAEVAIVVTAELTGYPPTCKPTTIPRDQAPTMEIFLIAATAQATVDSSVGGVTEDATTGARAVIPANALVDSTGAAVTGMVEVSIAPVDATDPFALRAFPGAFVGEVAGNQVSIETFNPMDISIQQGGNQLDLAPGQTADIFFPITRDDAPATIDLWSLNEETGIWVHEGTAFKVVDAMGHDVYKATISHLSWWNPDHPIQRSCVKTCVKDASGAPVGGASIKATGVGFGFEEQGVTGASGCHTILARKDYQIRIDVNKGSQLIAEPQVLTPTSGEGSCAADHQLNFTLTIPVTTDNCPSGSVECDGSCVDTHASIVHCGSCNNTCSAGEACIDDSCSCPSNRESCDGQCADVQTDNNNCGDCGNRCAVGTTCVTGACEALVCPTGFDRCGSDCVDPTSNRSHCGGCGSAGDLTSGFACGGTCNAECFGDTTPDPAVCGATCVDRNANAAHCGACGNACGATEECVNGSCLALSCGATEVACRGRCLNGDSCGVNCNSGTTCEAGACEPIDCGSNTLCGNDCVDKMTDEGSCGECGFSCNNAQECISGVCTCVGDLSACGDSCVDTSSSTTYCGDCFTTCNVGETCSGGSCTAIVCSSGELCGNDCITPLTDRNNCGGCAYTKAGDVGQWWETCDISNSSCGCPLGPDDTGTPPDLQGVTHFACPAPSGGMGGTVYYDCVDLTSTDQFCGACNVTCAPTETCSSATCVTKVCPSGSILCSDGRCVFGESCGEQCSDGEDCSAGSCACPTTTPDSCADVGCVDLATDVAHCGSCGYGCNIGEVCNLGVCALEPCTGGEFRCKGSCVNVQTNSTHCGGCNPASTGEASFGCSCPDVLSDGACDPSTSGCYCDGGTPCSTGNNSGTCADLQTNRSHCGSCGTVCPTGQECLSGNCADVDCGSETLCGNDCVGSPSCGISCNPDTSESCISGSCQ